MLIDGDANKGSNLPADVWFAQITSDTQALQSSGFLKLK